MAVAGDARPRHRRVDQAAVPLRPSTRMGAQAAAIPPATPIRTDRPPRPQNDPAALTRLALGRAARRRVHAPASAPTPNRLTRGASGALPDDQPRTPGRQPARKAPQHPRGRAETPPRPPQPPNQHPAAPSPTPPNAPPRPARPPTASDAIRELPQDRGQRQPLLGVELQDAEVPARVPRPVR